MPARKMPPTWRDQNHIDIGALAERVAGLENSISSIGDQLRDIGKRLDAKPTNNWWQVIGGVVGLLTLIGAFLYQGQQPVNFELARHDREIEKIMDTAVLRDDFKTAEDLFQRRGSEIAAANAKIADEIEKTRIELARTEGASEERHVEYLRNSTTLAGRIDNIDGNLIKRPEIESIVGALSGRIDSSNSAIGNRIDALSARINEIQHDFTSSFNLADAVKDLQDRLNQIPVPPK